MEIDGKAVGATLDAYAPQVLPSGSIEVSSGVELTKGQHRVRFTVIGTNGASCGAMGSSLAITHSAAT